MIAGPESGPDGQSVFSTVGAFELILLGFGAVITLTLAIVFYFLFLRGAIGEARHRAAPDEPSE